MPKQVSGFGDLTNMMTKRWCRLRNIKSTYIYMRCTPFVIISDIRIAQWYSTGLATVGTWV